MERKNKGKDGESRRRGEKGENGSVEGGGEGRENLIEGKDESGTRERGKEEGGKKMEEKVGVRRKERGGKKVREGEEAVTIFLLL